MTGWAKMDSLLCQCCVRFDSLLVQEVDGICFKPYSAAHGTKNIIANRLMAVPECSSIGKRRLEVRFLSMTVGNVRQMKVRIFPFR